MQDEDHELNLLNDPESYARPPTDAIYPVQSPYGDIHGLTPPPEDFIEFPKENLSSNLKHAFDLKADPPTPPTPPRTEAVSSPARCTSPGSPITKNLQLTTAYSPFPNPNSPESDLGMDYDMEIDLKNMVTDPVPKELNNSSVAVIAPLNSTQEGVDADFINDNNPFFDFASAASSPKPPASSLPPERTHLNHRRQFQSSFDDPNFRPNTVPVRGCNQVLSRKRSREHQDNNFDDDHSVLFENLENILPVNSKAEAFGTEQGNLVMNNMYCFQNIEIPPISAFNFSHPVSTVLPSSLSFAQDKFRHVNAQGSIGNSYRLFVDFPKHSTRTGSGEQQVKSRVETQIAVRLVIDPAPEGITKLRLPRHTISKIKYIDDTQPQSSADMWELDVSLVCASAMSIRDQSERALYEARGEPLPQWVLEAQNKKLAMGHNIAGTSIDTLCETKETVGGRDEIKKQCVDYSKPLFGATVQICEQCINRERKRAGRKKNKKPEEEQKWQQDEEKRIILFNTNQVRQFEPLQNSSGISAETQMRICCYCRHHGEKDGFRVIFTVRDHMGVVIAQTMSNTILITDDHKNTATATMNISSVGDSAASAGTSADMGTTNVLASSSAPAPYPQPGLLMCHNSDLHPVGPRTNGYNISGFSSPSISLTRTNSQSNPTTPARASPSPSQPQTKRRKSSKIPANLAMTPSDPSQLFQGHYPSSFDPQTPKTDLTSHGSHWLKSPSTPLSQHNYVAGTSEDFFGEINWSPQSRFKLVKSPSSSHQMIGYPLQLPMAINTAAQAPPFQQNPSVHRVVPSEGTMRGGIEITVLGRNFVNGLTVLFGDNPAIDTAFYSDTTLLCRLPPNQTPGAVVVSLKNMPVTTVRPESFPIFTYVDDVEKELMHLALTVVGMKMKGGQSGSSRQVALNILQESGMTAETMSSANNGSNNYVELEAQLLSCLDMIDMDESPHPARLTFRNKSGQTMLHLACMLGMQKFVAALLARGAHANTRDKNGYTPLHFAALFKRSDVVRRLLINRANAGLRTRNGETAADLGECDQIVRATRSVQQSHSRQHSRSSSASSESHFGPTRNGSLTSSKGTTGLSHSRASVDEFYDSSDYSSDDGSSGDEGISGDPPNLWSSSRRNSIHEISSSQPVIDAGGIQNVSKIGSALAASDTATSANSNTPSPPAVMAAWMEAWREQLTQSIQNLHLNMPAIPTASEYQNIFQNHMARFQNPMLKWKPQQKEDQDYKWSELFHPPAPPAYKDLYPDGNDGHASMPEKIPQVVIHPETSTGSIQPPRSVSPKLSATDLKKLHEQITSGEGHLSEAQKTQYLAHLRKLKRIESDRRLFFVWIPVLILIMTFLMFNRGPKAIAVLRTVLSFAQAAIEDPQQVCDRLHSLASRFLGVPG